MDKYLELKNLVETAEKDIIKAMDGNLKSGQRARASLRGVIVLAKEIRDATLELKRLHDANKQR